MRRFVYLASLGLIFLIPWEDSVTFTGFGTANRFIGLLVAGLWLVLIVYEGRIRKFSPFHLVALLFVLWNLSSVYWSSNQPGTMARSQTYFQLMMMIAIVWDLYDSESALNSGLQAIVFGACITIGSVVYNYVNGIEFSPGRFSAAGANPDEAGMVMALGIAIAWYLTLSTFDDRMQRRDRIFLIINSAYIPAALLGIALTATRTALIAIVPALVYMIISVNRLKLSVRILIFLFVIASFYLLYPYIPISSLERFADTGSELSAGDLSGRVFIWRQGLEAFTEHPLLGVGTSAFRTVNSVGKVAHNTLLSVLVEVGLVGLALFVFMLIITVGLAFRQPRDQAIFWLVILATWFIGATSLTWEHKKITWLLFSLIITSARIYSVRPWFVTGHTLATIVRGDLNRQDEMIGRDRMEGNVI